MTITPVEYLPSRDHTEYKKLSEFIELFLKMGIKYGRVDFSGYEYANNTSCRGAIHCYLLRNPDIPVKTSVIGGEVYLIRTDMED